MGQNGPCNFYCHQCKSGTHISSEEYTCSSCGSGFIEKYGENGADGSREEGATSSSDEPLALEHNYGGEHEVFGPNSMNEQIFAQAMGPNGIHGQRGNGSGPMVIRTIRRAQGPTGGTHSGGPEGTSTSVDDDDGPGDHLPHSLISIMCSIPGYAEEVRRRGGFGAIMAQLLDQIQNAGPPKMEKEDITGLPTISITQEHIDHKEQCSICMDEFELDESVNQLRCDHFFHKDCIKPWLELHATCPVCRKPQNDAAEAHCRQEQQNEVSSENDSNVNVSSSQFLISDIDENDSPVFDGLTTQDSAPTTTSNTPQIHTNSSTLSATRENRPNMRYFAITFNPVRGSQTSPSTRSLRNQSIFGFPTQSSTSNVNLNQSNASSQPTSSASEANGEENIGAQSSIPSLQDVCSSRSTEIGENRNSRAPSGSRSSELHPSADSSSGNSSKRLDTTGYNLSKSAP